MGSVIPGAISRDTDRISWEQSKSETSGRGEVSPSLSEPQSPEL